MTEHKDTFNLEAAYWKYHLRPDLDSLALVADSGRNLVYHFASLYAPGQPSEDAVQAGFEGLIKAASRFDPDRGVTFATYAGHCIMGEIRHYLRKEASFDRPGWVADLQGKVNRAIEDSLQQTGEVPTVSQIAQTVNVREEGVVEAMRGGWVSLDELDMSKIQNLRYETFRLPIEDRIVLEQALDKLSALQRGVINLLFYKDLTQTEAAVKLGISQRKVSRLLHKSLKQMAKYMSYNRGA